MGRDDGRWVGGSGSSSGAAPMGLPTGLAFGEGWISSVRRGVRGPPLLRPPGTGGFRCGIGDDIARGVLVLRASPRNRRSGFGTDHTLSTRHPVLSPMARFSFLIKYLYFSFAVSVGKSVFRGVKRGVWLSAERGRAFGVQDKILSLCSAEGTRRDKYSY